MAHCCPLSLEDLSVCSPVSPGKAAAWFKIGLGILVAAQSMTFGLAISLSPPDGTARTIVHVVLLISSLLVLVLLGGPVHRQAFTAARQKRIVFEQLFITGIYGSLMVSLVSSYTGSGPVFYEVISILLAIHTLGALLAGQRKEKALSLARNLSQQLSRCVRVTDDGQLEEVPLSRLQKGDIILARPGMALAVDGVVSEGTALVRQTARTGELTPVVKSPGDAVYAGSFVLDAPLRVKCEGESGSLKNLLNLIDAHLSRPSPLQREADRIVRWFLPLVILTALLTFFGWYIVAGVVPAMFNALAVLLVACPCAMGLATPIALWTAIDALARQGLIPVSANLVEKLAAIDTVIFDKTGTLSEAELIVSNWHYVDSEQSALIQSLAVTLESESHHPLASGICNSIQGKPMGKVLGFRTIPGVGVLGAVVLDSTEYEVALGNAELPSSFEGCPESWRSTIEGARKVFVSVNRQIVACINLVENTRDTAIGSIKQLVQSGFKVLILTGDERILFAQQLPPAVSTGTGLTPESKVAKIRQLQAKGDRVLFVGDGLNDAAAMAVADAGISFVGGSDLTCAAADGLLISGDLSMVPKALGVAQSVRKLIRSNLLFATVYNFVGMALAVVGLVHPVVASVLMVLASATVSARAFTMAGKATQPEAARKSKQQAVVKRQWDFSAALKYVPAFFVGSGLAVQGPLLVYLGVFQGGKAIALVGGFLIAGWALGVYWKKGQHGLVHRLFMLMISFGHLAMFVGWWFDTGFKPAIQKGICLCSCTIAHGGSNLGWMHIMMLGVSAPVMVLLAPKQGAEKSSLLQRHGHVVLCCVGMLLGMQGSSFVMSQFTPASANVHFLLTSLAMVLGMTLGMVAATGVLKQAVQV
ncbi:MAG: heavy metal translocating P-type ATPase [Verrucomicrobiota bacterium]|nr:heavy metal translocating P-type ATPase [Verrucomicrobiota bacterium]